MPNDDSKRPPASERAGESFTQELTRRYLLHLPPGDGPLPLLIAMHGYGGEMTGMMRLARSIAGERWGVASLQGPYPHIVFPADRSRPLGHGFGWISSYPADEGIRLHLDAVSRLIDTLAGRGAIDPARVFLLGFSQPVALNIRAAFRLPGRIRGVIGVCGGIPGDWERSEEYGSGEVDILYIGGRNDPTYPPDRIEANAGALRRRARSVDVRLYDVAHEFPRSAAPDIAQWISSRL